MDKLINAADEIATDTGASFSFLTDIFSMELFTKIFSVSIRICIILCLAYVGKKVLGTVVEKILNNRLTDRINEKVGRDINRINTLQKLIKSIIGYVIYFIAGLTILDMLGINVTALLAGAGIVSLAVAFGAQSIVKDLISGIFVIVDNQYAVGEYIKLGDTVGRVEEIGMKTTKILSYNGEILTIPNGNISTVVNYSRYAQRRNVDVGVAYEEDCTQAIAAVEKACQKINDSELGQYLDEKCHALGVFELADSSVVIRATFTAYDWKQVKIELALRQEIKDTLCEENVEIAYPKLQILQ